MEKAAQEIKEIADALRRAKDRAIDSFELMEMVDSLSYDLESIADRIIEAAK